MSDYEILIIILTISPIYNVKLISFTKLIIFVNEGSKPGYVDANDLNVDVILDKCDLAPAALLADNCFAHSSK